MENIFDIKFTYEQFVRDNVILKFSNKQGGDYNAFSSYWQCFAWAAVIGFLRDERKPLGSPLADRPFSLRTMQNNEGEKVAQALVCMCIAKNNSLDIMKNPVDAINMINEYANAGFYHILKLIETGENSFNDMQQILKEIFSRGTIKKEEKDEKKQANEYTEVAPEIVIESTKENELHERKKTIRWRTTEVRDLIKYYKQGMTIEQLAATFDKPKESVTDCLQKNGCMQAVFKFIHQKLRFAYEQSYPDNMVDASDAYILIVFPFKHGDKIPDDYDVVNYETGMFEGKPALRKIEGKQEILVID